MTQLTTDDAHHWGPVPSVMASLDEGLDPDARVLEIGPGHIPFARATTFVDFAPKPELAQFGKVITCDLSRERLPFPDKSFEFVFCRHVLEDMYNPFLLCEEMSRVGHAGYVETPSPIAEMGRGVDGSSPAYRGYHHHRYFVWEFAGRLCFLAKYPIVEYLGCDDAGLVGLLRAGPLYWNTHHLWSDRIDVQHIQNTLDFDLPRDYQALVAGAISQAKASAEGSPIFANLTAPRDVGTAAA